MFGFDEARENHQEVYGSGGYDNQAKFSHEVIGGAAAFEGMKLYEDHQRKEGNTVSHAFAKELLMGFVGGEVDKLAETKGMNFVDKEKAEHRAKKGAERMYDEHYIQGQGANDYDPNQYNAPNFRY